MNPFSALVLLAIGIVSLVTIITHKLTIAGAIGGGLLAVILFHFAGVESLSLMAAFFAMGVAATSFRSASKIKKGFAEHEKGKRDIWQVFANGGAAGIIALTGTCYPSVNIHIAIAGIFASAAADTVSSELGSVTGRRFYNILTFKTASAGANGVISLEGSLLGIAASGVIATLYSFWHGWHMDFIFIVIAGTAGNLADSVLGATLENNGWLGNNGVNLLNTLIAAVIALLLNQSAFC